LFTSPALPISGISWLNIILYSLFFLIVADLGARKPALIWRLPLPIFLAFSFNCLSGLLQFKAFSFLGTDSTGYTGLYTWWPFKTSDAINYFAGLQAPSRLSSAAGTLGNQNVLGGYLTATIPLFTILPMIVIARWRQMVDGILWRYQRLSEGSANALVGALVLVLGANAIISYAAILATDTRGAWIGMAAALLLAIAIVPAFFREQLGKVSRLNWSKILLGVIVSLVLLGAISYSAGITPKRLQGKIMSTWTIKQRLVAWEVAVAMANERPVLGQGLGTYKIRYFHYLAQRFAGKPIPTYMHHRYVQAHNDLVQLAAEAGYVGLLLGMIVLGIFWIAIPRYIWRRRPSVAEGLLLLAAMMGTIGMTVFAISGFPFHIAASSAVWTALAGMAGAFLWRERREQLRSLAQESQAYELPLGARWVFAVVTGVFAAALVFFIYLPYRADILTKEGMERYKQGKVTEAATFLKKAIALDPERGDARLVLGITLAMTNHLKEAADQLIRSQTSYDDVTLHYYLGRVYEAQQNEPAARAEYNKALSYFPEGTEVRKIVTERLALMSANKGSASP
ncbi:MAG: O-antigen ligase family protein, partial [Cyanobacteria bacterium NC_groundwater_1444_Ag_S-0.65um_54_12]|nr:O-antigen ligase family protein [Cyanobacteria bacterium NC_groundwater_1444_Ag_S-0.65um_54_12]